MSTQTFKITADVTMNNSNVNISNLATIDLPPKFTSFTISDRGVPFDQDSAERSSIYVYRGETNTKGMASDAARRFAPGTENYFNAYQDAVAHQMELSPDFNTAINNIVYGQYFHVYDTLYMKKDFLTYIQFINNRWMFFFRFADVFYCFYRRNNTDKFMDIDSIQNGLFINANLHKFNISTNTLQRVTAFYRDREINLRIQITTK